MPTREQVLALLDEGHSYETAANVLHVPAGQAFMIATGVPADGSDALHPDEEREKRMLPGSSQHLVNPPPFNPKRNADVTDWVKQRAAHDLTQDS
jgi:hypothetical protein